MPLSTDQTQSIFKIIGKLIYLSRLADPQVTAFRKTAMGLVDQGIDGDADEFDFHAQVCIPAAAAVSAVNAALAEVPTNAQASIESYLSRFVAPLVGLTVGTTAGVVIDSLVSEMTPETVLAGGQFAEYFDSTWSKALPSAVSGAESIPDAWVTNEVI